jgi:hypothetical protein
MLLEVATQFRLVVNCVHLVIALYTSWAIGNSSTTWLPHDERLAKYVAIKFAVSELDRSFKDTVLTNLWDGEIYSAKVRADIVMITEILDEFEV